MLERGRERMRRRPSDLTGERVPPQNIEAEVAVLGAILQEREALLKALEVLREEHFYREAHRKIYAACIALFGRNEPVDLITLSNELDRGKVLEEVGGVTYLTYLVDAVPTAANVAYHAQIVRDKAVLRQLISVATDIVGMGHADREDVDEILDLAEREIFQISQDRVTRAFVSLKDILKGTFEVIERLQHRRSRVTGVPTGFPEFDQLTSGLQPSDLIIIAGRPSMGKCLKHDAELVDPLTGEVLTMEEAYRRREARLLTLDGNYRLHPTSPIAFVDDGIKPVYRVRTSLGREVETTLSHPFLTLHGWCSLADLQVGERIAVPRTLPAFGFADLPDSQVKLLAYLLADGDLTGPNPGFTNADPQLRRDFIEAAEAFGGLRVRVEDSRGRRTPTCRVAKVQARDQAVGIRLLALRRRQGLGQRALARRAGISPAAICQIEKGRARPSVTLLERVADVLGISPAQVADLPTLERSNGLARWLGKLGLRGKRAQEKFVPSPVFGLKREELALFLNRLFACDGSVAIYRTGQVALSYSTTSRQLARQVQHLLLRFGILSKLREKRVSYNGGRRLAYEVEILGAEDIQRFAQEIGIYGKEERLAQAVGLVQGRGRGWTKDTLPMEIWEEIERAKGGLSWAEVSRRLGHPRGHNLHGHRRSPSRRAVAQLAEALESQELRDLATSDIYWDRIISIEYIGDHQVYDLTIPETHNFVAADVVVHNTSFSFNVAQYAAMVERVPVALFSLEMSKEQVVQRMLCSEARVDSWKVRTGAVSSKEDYPRLIDAASRLSEAPIFIDDTPGISVLEMRAKARRLKAEEGLDLVIVDYLQMIQARGRAESRQQEISEISRSLKAMAKELRVPVVALSQLSRRVEDRTPPRPQLADLRESGAIEQDADLVALLYRPGFYRAQKRGEGEAGYGDEDATTEVIIAKQRNGPTGVVKLAFLREYARFGPLDAIHGEPA